MAESENLADAAVTLVVEAKTVRKTSKEAEEYFKRLEKCSKELAGTVPSYDRHVFLCYKSPESWPPRFHKSEINTHPKLFANYFLARRDKLAVQESDIRGFIDDVHVRDIPWVFGLREKLTGSHIFVCAHGSRRKIYGVCGPVLIEKLNEGIEARGLKDVYVSGCSDVKGHVYAPNVLVYRSDSEERVTGHWYGYVTPDDVPNILDQHIGKGEAIERKLRGLAGVFDEDDDEENVLNVDTGVIVAGAIVTIAVAYIIYRRSGWRR